MKIIVYGIGKYYTDHQTLIPKDAEIVAYGDGSKEKATSYTGKKFKGLNVLLPSEMKNIDYDYIYIAAGHGPATEIYEELKNMEFPLNKIRFLYRIDSWTNWDYWVDDTGIMISDINGVKIYEKNKNDQGVLIEIFSGRCYNIDILKKNTIVVDFGMNIGAATLFFASNPNVEKVYSFEPFSDTYESALENIKLNDEKIREKIYTFNCAVADFDGSKEIAVLTEFSGGRTTEIDCVENVTNKRVTKIQYCDAEKVLEKIIAQNENRPIVIKMDVEGSEFVIFKSIKKLLRRFDAIVMEYHRDPEELVDILRDNDYRCITIGQKSIGLIYAINMNATI